MNLGTKICRIRWDRSYESIWKSGILGENLRTWEQRIEDKYDRRYDGAEGRKSEKMYGPGNKRMMVWKLRK